jgi:hypothetical protein
MQWQPPHSAASTTDIGMNSSPIAIAAAHTDLILPPWAAPAVDVTAVAAAAALANHQAALVIVTSPIAVNRNYLDPEPSSPPPAFTPSCIPHLDVMAAGATDAATAAAAAATAKLQGQEHISAAPTSYRKAGCYYGDGDGDGGSTRAL